MAASLVEDRYLDDLGNPLVGVDGTGLYLKAFPDALGRAHFGRRAANFGTQDHDSGSGEGDEFLI